MNKTEAMAKGAHCAICPLNDEGEIVPPSPASGRLRLVIVGEGPGRTEERMGRPFVGMSGKLLDTELSKNALLRSDCHITNVALCRGEGDKENERAAECCAPRLLREIAELPHETPILALGKSAAKATLGVRSLLVARGFVWNVKPILPSHVRNRLRIAYKMIEGKRRDNAVLSAETLAARMKLEGRCVLPTIHPSFVLRADTWAPIWRVDFSRAVKLATGKIDPKRLEDRGTHKVGSPDILRGLGRVVSCDIETDDIHPLETNILCIGFTDEKGKSRVVWPWKREYGKDVTRFLKSRSAVVFHNGYQFDQLVMMQQGIDFRGVKLEDTLLAHHAYASHLPQRLDHVVSEYCNSSPWKVKFGRRGKEEKGLAPVHMDAEELCLYNAADARLTSLAWHRMQPDLERETAVYEHDKGLAAICRDMTRNGIGVDNVLREQLSDLSRRRRAMLLGRMRGLIGEATFNPGKLDEVRRVLFTKLRGQYVAVTSSGVPSTANATLEALKGNDTKLSKFADALLQWRLVGKIKSTYIDKVRIHPVSNRTHFNYKPFGTVSGRLSSRFQSIPRWNPKDVSGRVREIYIPAKGNTFVYFDVSQAEMRLAAFLAADPVFMAACGSDVHEGNARNVFPDVVAKGWFDGDAKKDPARGKPYRDIAKNLGFAIAYGAEADKVFMTLRSKGFEVTYRAVELILARLRAAYKVYYRFVETNLTKVREVGFMRTPILGRIRWFGWSPKPTEISNFPVQSALADIMNLRMVELAAMLPKEAKLVSQIHDSCIYDTPLKLAGEVERCIKEVWSRPVNLAGGPLILPIDFKVGGRLSEF